MWHWLALGTFALFAGASASRKAKQRTAEMAWHRALPRRFGLMLVDLDTQNELGDVEEAARAMAGSAVFTFYEYAGVSDFADLMRHLSRLSHDGRSDLEAAVVGRLMESLPLDVDPLIARREIRRALTGAGQEAMDAARRSKHL